MPDPTPWVPPKVQAQMPTDPFERWLVVQALQGHDRDWLRRNAPALRQRWQADPEANLPVPLAPRVKPYDRYAEL